MAISFCGCISLIVISQVLLTSKFCEAKQYQSGRTYTSKQTCTELEHCRHFNATIGQCTGTGNPCLPGWMGPGCQYFNLAYTSRGQGPLFDGSWNNGESRQRIHVQLQHTFIVSAINIILGPRSSGLTVSVADNTGEVCYSGLFPQNTWTIFCNRVLKTKNLNVTLNASIFVREVEVFGGQNVALWKQTNQSSTYIYSHSYTSDKAVDGSDSRHNFSHNSCTHTIPGQQGDVWWKVDLGNFYSVMSILIANRYESNSKRIDGFSIFGKTRDNGEIFIYHDENLQQIPRKDIWIDSENMPTKPVNEIVIKGNANSSEKILTLCEVFVFACSPTNDGRVNCDNACPWNCVSNESCVNFACLKCKEGWSGIYCDKHIPIQKYCTLHTRRNFTTTNGCTHLEHCSGQFNITNHTCNGQCEPGWMGPGCQYINLALNDLNRDMVFDGNQLTHRNIGFKAHVVLNGMFIISAVNIHVFSGLSADVVIKDNQSVVCYTGRVPRTATVYFSRVVRTNTLTLDFNKDLDVKEIEVFGGKNIALWKSTRQSSNYNGNWTSGNAVDGWGGGGYIGNDTCTHTADMMRDTHPTWSVTLGEYYSVISVHIINRKGNANRINKFLLYGMQRDKAMRLIYNDTTVHPALKRKDIWIDSRYWNPEPVNVIVIDARDTPEKILSLCEVYVLACRPLENGVDDCISYCPNNCVPTEFCLNDEFTCPKCISGWKGNYCEEAVQCVSKLTDHLQIQQQKDKYSYNESVSFSCVSGYHLVGSKTAVCGQQNKWNISNFPTCNRITCSLPQTHGDDTRIITTNASVVDFDTDVYFSCKPGFYLSEEGNSRKCRNDGPLILPECKDESSRSPKTSLNVAAVVGGLVGLVVFLILISITIVIIRWRLKKKGNIYEHSDRREVEDQDHQYAELNTIVRDNEFMGNASERNYYNMHKRHDVENDGAVPPTEYSELSTTMNTSKSAIKVSVFKDYLNTRTKDFFAEEHKTLTCGFQIATTSTLKPENRNEYENTFLDEETPKVRKLNSDYTNASFIHGYENSMNYITAEGPTTNTINNFWRMVWNERCRKIVMLTNMIDENQVKSVQYWPDKDRTRAGSLTIETVDVHTYADFITRTFRLRNGNEERTIQQFQFNAWSDQKTPSYISSLVLFYHKVVNTVDYNNGPMLVHCRSGIGGTGTFIALYYLIHQAMQSGYVDVYCCVYNLRHQHISILQTLEQYVFFHDVLNEALMLPATVPTIQEFPQRYEELMTVDPKTGKRYIDIHFEDLPSRPSFTSTENSLGICDENRKKNRFSNILPAHDEMPQIRNEENKLIYINAVFLPGYRSKRSSIVTQMPLTESVEDFWWLLYNQNVSTVVMLNQTENNKTTDKENIGWYWPVEAEEVRFGPFRVVKESTCTANKDYEIIDLLYTTPGKVKRRIRVFKNNFWPDSATIPSSVLPVLKLIKEVELHQSKKNTSPVVVHCINGAGKSGLFCALQFVLERLKVEHDIAIHHAIKMMRCVRPSILPNVEQFKFCHDVVMEFIKLSDVSSFLK